MRGLIAGAGALIIIATCASTGVLAQTLADPNPRPTAPPSTVTTKSHSARHVKNCSAYGPGFMAMPGSDMCIKIGGGVTVEVGH
jgi:Porin subfamily